MTDPPPRRWPQILGLSCVTILILGGLTVVGTFCYSRVSYVNGINRRNFAAVQPVIASLHSYRRQNGRYPKSLCDLHIAQRPRLEGSTQILYSASDNGSEYWLAIDPWREWTSIMFSDFVNEYSSSASEWSTMDNGDARAKFDDAWFDECLPPHKTP